MSRHTASERKVILWTFSLVWEPSLLTGPMIAFEGTLITIQSLTRPASEQGAYEEEDADFLYWLFRPESAKNFNRLLLLSS